MRIIKAKEKQNKAEAKQQVKQAKLEQKKKKTPLLELNVENLHTELPTAAPSKETDSKETKPEGTKEMITTVAEIVSVKQEDTRAAISSPAPGTSKHLTMEPVEPILPAFVTIDDKPREPSPSGFSFKKTVKNLLIFKSKKKPEPKSVNKDLHEQMVINIEMVAKHTPLPLEETRPCPTFVVSMPSLEPLTSPSDEDNAFEDGGNDSQDVINMNLLEITEISKSTKEVNAQRIKQDKKDKIKKEEESRRKKEAKRAKEEEEERQKRERKHDKEVEEAKRKMERKKMKEEEERLKKEEKIHAKEMKDAKKKIKKVEAIKKEEKVVVETAKEDTKKKKESKSSKLMKDTKDQEIESIEIVAFSSESTTSAQNFSKSETEKKPKKKKETSLLSTKLITKAEPKVEHPIEDQPIKKKPPEKVLRKAVKVDTPSLSSAPAKTMGVEEKKKKVRIIENIQLEPKKKKKSYEAIQPEISEPGPSRGRSTTSKSSLLHKLVEVEPTQSTDRKKKSKEKEEDKLTVKVSKKHPKKDK